MLTSGVFGYLADYCLWWVLFASLVVHTWCFFKFFPRKRWTKLGLLLGNALVLLCMLGVVAIGAESYLRFLSVETDSFGMSLPARRWFALHTSLNSLGCRDVEWTSEPRTSDRAGFARIAFVGDSFVYGWGIESVHDRLTERLAAKFDRQAPNQIEIMNVAKPGWDTGDQIAPVRDMIHTYGVDEIVLGYVPNDIEKLLPRTAEFDPIRPPEPGFFNIYSSCLIDYLYRRYGLPLVPTVYGYHDWLADGYADPAIWKQQQQQLGTIMGMCKDAGVKLRVVLLPFLRTSGTKYHPEGIHSLLREFFETNGVEVVDLLPIVAGQDVRELVVNALDAHPNAHAHKLFADAIWEAFYGAGNR